MEKRTLKTFLDEDDLLLVLDNLMVLVPYNEWSEKLLKLLETLELIPHTVSWCDEEGTIYRLYVIDDSEAFFKPLYIDLGEIYLEMWTGFSNYCQIPAPWQRESGLKWLPDKSLEDMNPAYLPSSSVSWLEALAMLSSGLRKKRQEQVAA